MINSKNYNFSYSGLKTAVLYKIRDLKAEGIELTKDVINQICYEFQNAAVDVLVEKTIRAAKEFPVRSILLSGGVSANTLLRERLANASRENNLKYFQPDLKYTTDNAAMIALAGYFTYQKNPKNTAWQNLDMHANLTF